MVFVVLFACTYVAYLGIDYSTYRNMDYPDLVPQILTPFNYVDWREYMEVSLRNLGMYRMTMGRETKPHHHTEKNNFLNRLDEEFGFLCTHIFKDFLFNLVGLKNPK